MFLRCGRICQNKLSIARDVYFFWKDGAARNKLFLSKTPFKRTVILLKKPSVLFSAVKTGKYSVSKIHIWKALEWLGVSHCSIVNFRRRTMRFRYPWLAYSVPAGVILGVGDVIAQYYLAPRPSDSTIARFFSADWIRERTLVYMLLGFLLVGPVLSKWNLFWYRRLRCRGSQYFLIKTFLDLFVLSPVLLATLAVIYDQRYGVNIFTDPPEKTKKCFECKYTPAIADVMMFNILTRPFMVLALCYLVPCNLRGYFRTFYEIAFATYLSDSFLRHKLRTPPPPPPPPPPSADKPRCSKKDTLKRPWKWPC